MSTWKLIAGASWRRVYAGTTCWSSFPTSAIGAKGETARKRLTDTFMWRAACNCKKKAVNLPKWGHNLRSSQTKRMAVKSALVCWPENRCRKNPLYRMGRVQIFTFRVFPKSFLEGKIPLRFVDMGLWKGFVGIEVVMRRSWGDHEEVMRWRRNTLLSLCSSLCGGGGEKCEMKWVEVSDSAYLQ